LDNSAEQSASYVTVDVLDVGHGSCVSIRTDSSVALVDAGPGVGLLLYLESLGIHHVDEVLISHSDHDHVGGLLAMLNNGFSIGRIHMNADASKESVEWDDLAFAVDDAIKRGASTAVLGVVEGYEVFIEHDDVCLAVLGPRPYLVAKGAGARDRLSGRRLSPNSMSLIVRLDVAGEHIALMPGDVDDIGLLHALDREQDLSAEILVLSHHGGLMGTKATTPSAVQTLCDEAGASVVFVSNRRDENFRNPRPEVVAAVRKALPSAHLACTQLSQLCASRPPMDGRTNSILSLGQNSNHMCAGSSRLIVDKLGQVNFDRLPHQAFIKLNVPAALCRT
jgi:beta-lactamase superfamily II metal-dependent hydrolase